MAWETRKGTSNVYYTRSYRSDGDLVREYLGNGPLGREAARQCDEIRELREQKRDHDSQRMLIMAECERLCVAFYEFVDLVLDCEMLVAGYHYHRGEWRKRRVPKEKPAAEQAVNGAVTASGPSSECSQPEQSRQEPEPRRRSKPKRRPLDCRLGLVRNKVAFRSAKERTFAERKTTMGKRSRNGVGCFIRLGSVGTTKCSQCEISTRPHLFSDLTERSCLRRTVKIGRSQLPRPPPAQMGSAG